MKLDLPWLINSVKGKVLTGSTDGSISCVSTDSRNIQPGTLFIALRGERFDGHDFLAQVEAKGVQAVIISEPDALPKDFTPCAILVKDTLQALQDLAAAYRNMFTLPVVAVTGSVGKTTTRDVLSLCLSSRYSTLKTEGNFNNEIGLPLTLLRLEAEHQMAVLEMAMRAAMEIDELARIARPDYAIITAVEPVHLETLGSLENIARAKTELLAYIPSEGFALINGDNESLVKAAGEYSCRQYRFGFSPVCDVQIQDVELAVEGMQISLKIFEHSARFFFPVPARRLAYNVAAAAGMAYMLGVAEEDIQKALKGYQPSGSRLRLAPLEQGGLLIDDCYNANPLSMQVGLELCRDLAHGRRTVAVLGDMFELGSFEQEGHLMVGRSVAENDIKQLVTLGSRAVWIAEGARKAGMSPQDIHAFQDRTEAQNWLREHVSQEDVVLFKASRGMQLEEIIQAWMAED